MGQSSWAQIRDFQTTRLLSTGGAGVASVLATEAAILNPATAAFFNSSSFSYQSVSTSLRHESDLRTTNQDNFAKRNNSQGIFMADHGGPVKGGISYLTQNENKFSRDQLVMHASAPIGAQASMGFSYRYIQDKMPRSYSDRHQIIHQMTAGGLYIIDEHTTLGLVAVDPTHSNPGDERAIGGIQYTISDRLMIIGDVGTQYTKAASKHYLWRAAVQLNVFSDFFFRVGKFYDKITYFEGTGWGVSWLGPKLGVEFSQKFSDQFGKNSYIYKKESLVDTALALVIKF